MSAPEIKNNESGLKQKMRFPWVATLIALVAVVIMLRLGFWQIQRANNKQERLQQIEQRSDTAALTIEDALSMEGDFDDFQLQANGIFNQHQYFLLDNRVLNQKVGYEVIAPFETGSHVLLVNLGWIQAPPNRDKLPEVNLPGQEIRVHGMISQPTKNPFVSQGKNEATNGAMRIQEVDISRISQVLGSQVVPFVLQLAPEHEIGYERHWKPVVMSPEKHWAYAVQWFGLALACAVIYVVAIKKKYQRGS